MSRINKDVAALLRSPFEVRFPDDDNIRELHVLLPGPDDSLYEGGLWIVRVELPTQYPYHSPSVGFLTKIYHPNIEESSGSICLDVINQTWTPMYTLVNIFETFIPQLLRYPNVSDPLNAAASRMYNKNMDDYTKKVIEYVTDFADVEAVKKKFIGDDKTDVDEETVEKKNDDTVIEEYNSNFEDESDIEREAIMAIKKRKDSIAAVADADASNNDDNTDIDDSDDLGGSDDDDDDDDL